MKEGREYLAANAKKEGVVTTASGLQYRVLTHGDGPKPGPRAEVEVHYEGRLIDGSVFDSSYARGESIAFFLSQVIPGWSEGVRAHAGWVEVRGSTIPFELAYGPKGIPGVIPPHSTLIFDVELLKIY
ncbi:MAG: FKBP-type peptidyl-prolyl cis-trans isomerase [Chloroflexi bacterium]|nr:FKBP-type peptidyl-prolyl cis-trans isomerase [Chloroflexota bacterium]